LASVSQIACRRPPAAASPRGAVSSQCGGASRTRATDRRFDARGFLAVDCLLPAVTTTVGTNRRRVYRVDDDVVSTTRHGLSRCGEPGRDMSAAKRKRLGRVGEEEA